MRLGTLMVAAALVASVGYGRFYDSSASRPAGAVAPASGSAWSGLSGALADARTSWRRATTDARTNVADGTAQVSPGASITVGFSPGNAEQTVVGVIDGAKRTIDVAAYSFTSRPIASALLRAKERGVRVAIVADRSQKTARYTSVRFLANKGIPVRIDSRYAIMHNKFMVVDNSTVETGSFNYTKAATLHNAENVLVVRDAPSVAARYATEWQRLWNESEAL